MRRCISIEEVSEPLLIGEETLFERVYFHEILRVMEQELTPREQEAVWKYLDSPRSKPSKRAQQAIQKIRDALGVSFKD